MDGFWLAVSVYAYAIPRSVCSMQISWNNARSFEQLAIFFVKDVNIDDKTVPSVHKIDLDHKNQQGIIQ
jgi:hypothetical protein